MSRRLKTAEVEQWELVALKHSKLQKVAMIILVFFLLLKHSDKQWVLYYIRAEDCIKIRRNHHYRLTYFQQTAIHKLLLMHLEILT